MIKSLEGFTASDSLSQYIKAFTKKENMESFYDREGQVGVKISNIWIDFIGDSRRPTLQMEGYINALNFDFENDKNDVDDAKDTFVEDVKGVLFTNYYDNSDNYMLINYNFTNEEIANLTMKGLFDEGFFIPDVLKTAEIDLPVRFDYQKVKVDGVDNSLIIVDIHDRYNYETSSKLSGYQLDEYFDDLSRTLFHDSNEYSNNTISQKEFEELLNEGEKSDTDNKIDIASRIEELRKQRLDAEKYKDLFEDEDDKEKVQEVIEVDKELSPEEEYDALKKKIVQKQQERRIKEDIIDDIASDEYEKMIDNMKDDMSIKQTIEVTKAVMDMEKGSLGYKSVENINSPINNAIDKIREEELEQKQDDDYELDI